MRIGLNLLHGLPEVGGVWNYMANLLRALAQHDHATSYTAFATSASACLVPEAPNFKVVRVPLRSSRRVWRVAYENSLLLALARKSQVDCLHWFANTGPLVVGVPSVVTVHDLQAFRRASGFSLAKRCWLSTLMRLTLRKAKLVLPVSNATGQDLSQLLGIPQSRMVTITATIPDCFSPARQDVVAQLRAKYRLPPSFWLYVAHYYPHKNHVRLLQAYHALKESGARMWPLVLRGDPQGAEGQVLATVSALGLRNDVVMLPRLPEHELPALYSAAAALVFPSLYEGGGMPVVEAMACNCPVLASDIPPVREFAAAAAAYFDPLDPASIADGMARFQNGAARRERRLGPARATAFRGRRVVQALVGAYARATG